MANKAEVKRMLKESGNLQKFTDERYLLAKRLLKYGQKNDAAFNGYIQIMEFAGEQYIHDLIINQTEFLDNTIEALKPV